MHWRCHSKVTEHVAFLARRCENFGGIGHIRFDHPHEIIEWVICSQGCFKTKFRNRFHSEVPVDSTWEVQLSDHKNLNYKHFQCLKQSLKALLEIEFPMLISVESKFATYHHVVVVWREMVIDYESMHMYPLTKDTLRQICGVNTTFQRISSGYGILP